MAKDDDGDWKSCVKAILSASQTSYSNSNIPGLVALITKRYKLAMLTLILQVYSTRFSRCRLVSFRDEVTKSPQIRDLNGHTKKCPQCEQCEQCVCPLMTTERTPVSLGE